MSIVLILGSLVSIGFLVVTVLVIVSIINNTSIDNNNKIFWIAMVLLFNILGLVVYLVVNDKNVLK